MTQMNIHALQQFFVSCILTKMGERCYNELFCFITVVDIWLTPVNEITFWHSTQPITAKKNIWKQVGEYLQTVHSVIKSYNETKSTLRIPSQGENVMFAPKDFF